MQAASGMSTMQTNLLPGVILAGGMSRRMGTRDKGLIQLGDRTLLQHVVDRFAPQVQPLALNANGETARFSELGLPVLPDRDFAGGGPLAGILTALRWASDLGAESVVTVSCDCPFLPCDFVTHLQNERTKHGGGIVLAAGEADTYAVTPHPTCAIWPVDLAPSLHDRLAQGRRQVLSFADDFGAARAIFAADRYDPFFNINTPSDLARAQIVLAEHAK